MVKFDFIDDSAKAYAFLWHNRYYIFSNMLSVLFVKILCILVILNSFISTNQLREGILMLPSHALEAFFLASLIRCYLYGEPIHIWGKFIEMPADIQKNSFAPLLTYTRKMALQVGSIYYLLIKMALSSLVALTAIEVPAEYKETIGTPDLAKAIAATVVLGVFFWSLRLLWLYVPASLSINNKFYLKKISGIENSLYFLGVIIICTLPMLLLYSAVTNLFLLLFGENSPIFLIVTIILQSFVVIIIISLQTLAVARGTYNFVINDQKP